MCTRKAERRFGRGRGAAGATRIGKMFCVCREAHASTCLFRPTMSMFAHSALRRAVPAARTTTRRQFSGHGSPQEMHGTRSPPPTHPNVCECDAVREAGAAGGGVRRGPAAKMCTFWKGARPAVDVAPAPVCRMDARVVWVGPPHLRWGGRSGRGYRAHRSSGSGSTLTLCLAIRGATKCVWA
eukprot:COSAG06_NODE_375_length_16679_cov_2.832509_2_plen_183_part_00